MSRSEWDAIDREKAALDFREAQLNEREAELNSRHLAIEEEKDAWAEKIVELTRIETVLTSHLEGLPSPFNPLRYQCGLDPTMIHHAFARDDAVGLYSKVIRRTVTEMAHAIARVLDEGSSIIDHRYRVPSPERLGKFAVQDIVWHDLESAHRREGGEDG